MTAMSMSYVTVKDETKDRLHLRRDPSMLAWGLFAGSVALGFGAAFYTTDSLVWQLLYISCSVFVGLTWMEDWEDCIFDKVCGTVTLQRQSLIQKLFHATKGQKIVVDQLANIAAVEVHDGHAFESSKCKYYNIVLHCHAGYTLQVTETATGHEPSEHKAMAQKIRQFLGLPDDDDVPTDVPAAIPTDTPNVASAVENSGENSSNGSSDEGFERIDPAELVEEENTADSGGTPEKTTVQQD